MISLKTLGIIGGCPWFVVTVGLVRGGICLGPGRLRMGKTLGYCMRVERRPVSPSCSLPVSFFPAFAEKINCNAASRGQTSKNHVLGETLSKIKRMVSWSV